MRFAFVTVYKVSGIGAMVLESGTPSIYTIGPAVSTEDYPNIPAPHGPHKAHVSAFYIDSLEHWMPHLAPPGPMGFFCSHA